MRTPRYRYTLERSLVSTLPLGAERRVLFCMLNPSTADEVVDDPTIKKVKKFAQREGGTVLRVVNLYAARATKSTELPGFDDPVGPDNDETVLSEALMADLVVAGWGDGALEGPDPDRAKTVLALLRSAGDVYRLGSVTEAGNPRHPLYRPAGEPLILHAPRRLLSTAT